ncbi:hypothetical protein CCICO_04425 [Corynebacterium ciconiae DSM 44920]|uniref:hypothetical protein n=1 Tax=Corynebacterium ciconiae TaxID=227319 RepID=UPI0003666D2E|nr:hypothetical protein [Corynebacterium ciconiae]WKD60922.1 hypothetical protein CCICO_04425 [Corynebacterium ciconiae DSM 44920]
MSQIDLDAILAQRAEATGAEEGRIPFTFKGETFTFRDPMMLDDEDQELLEDIADSEDARLSEIAEFWMGEEEWERFRSAGGTAPMFRYIIEENSRREQEADAAGKSSARINRSQRRAAGRKR